MRFYSKSHQYIGDSHGIAALVGFFYAYDDIEDPPPKGNHVYSVEGLEKLIIQSVREWLEEYAHKIH